MISYKNAFLYFSFLHQDDDPVMETPLWKLADELDDGEGGDGRDWMSRDGPSDSTVTDGIAVEGGGMESGEGIGVGDLRHCEGEAPNKGFDNVGGASNGENDRVDEGLYKYGGVYSEDNLNRDFYGYNRRQEAVSTGGEEMRVQGGTAPDRVQDGVALDRRAREDQCYDQVTTGQPGDALTSRPEESPLISDWFEEEFGIARDASCTGDERFPAGVSGWGTGTVEEGKWGQDAIDPRGFDPPRPLVDEASDMDGVLSSRGEGWEVRDDTALAADDVLDRSNAEPPPIGGVRDEFGDEVGSGIGDKVRHDDGVEGTEGEQRKRRKRRYLDLEVFCDDENGEEMRLPPVRLDMRSDSRGTGVSRDARINMSRDEENVSSNKGFVEFGQAVLVRVVRGVRSAFETYLDLGQDDVDGIGSEGGGDVIDGKTGEGLTSRNAGDSDKER